MSGAEASHGRGVGTGDVLGWRLKLATLIPSTNTVVEPEYSAMAPDGVTVHAGRIEITNPDTGSDSAFEHLLEQVSDALPAAIARVMTCQPSHLALGMTAVAFVGGRQGEDELAARIEDTAGASVTSGPDAVASALDLYGVGRVAIVSPYQPVAEAQVRRYFSDIGRDVVSMRSLRSPTATSIAQTPEDETRRVVAAAGETGAEAVVQLGTNLPMVRLLDELETRLDKPVIAINAATLWKALRVNGVNDAIAGFGSLLRDH